MLTEKNTELKDQATHLALAGVVLADRLRQAEVAARLPDNVLRFRRA